MQRADDVRDFDCAVVGMPAVVIGDHRDGGVAKFCFACEFGFGHVGHTDHIAPPLAVEVAFGHRRKLRALHREVGTATVNGRACRTRCGLGCVHEAGAGRVRDADMRHKARTKE